MPTHRKTIKWWKKLAFHFLSLTMIQAYCLYLKLRKQLRRKPVTLEDFATSVCFDLARLPPDDAAADPPGAAVPASDDVNRLACRQQHFMEKITHYKHCHVCYAMDKARGATREHLKNKVQRTRFQCRQCRKALCVVPCMAVYHTKLDFSK